MTKDKNEPRSGTATDIGELQDTLGVIIASYTYLFDPWARVEEVNRAVKTRQEINPRVVVFYRAKHPVLGLRVG